MQVPLFKEASAIVQLFVLGVLIVMNCSSRVRPCLMEKLNSAPPIYYFAFYNTTIPSSLFLNGAYSPILQFYHAMKLGLNKKHLTYFTSRSHS